MAWIRAVPALALAVVLAAGCDEGGAAPAGKAAAVAGPAGEVIHIEGTVTAVRPGEQPRTLALGSPVHADDTISVQMSSEISIVLAHNKVQWDIGAGQSYRVDESRAWKASSGSGSALDEQGDLGTASAGRHGEREAGETQATASAEAAPREETPPAATAVPAVPAVPEPTTAETVRHRAVSDGARSESTKEPLRGKALGLSPTDELELGVSPGAGAGGGAGPSGGAPPDVKSATATAAPRVAMVVTLGEIKARGALKAADLSAAFASFSVAACRPSQLGTVVLRFEISADGVVLKPRLTGPAPLVAEAKSCVTAAARKLSFPASANGSTFIEREIRFSANTK